MYEDKTIEPMIIIGITMIQISKFNGIINSVGMERAGLKIGSPPVVEH